MSVFPLFLEMIVFVNGSNCRSADRQAAGIITCFMRRWRPSLLYSHHFISTFRPPPAFIKDDTRIVLHFTLSVSPGSIHGAVLFVNSYSRMYSVLHWSQQETGQLSLHSITSPHSACLSINLAIFLSVCQSYIPFVCLSVYFCVGLSGYMSISLFVCLSVCLYIYIPDYFFLPDSHSLSTICVTVCLFVILSISLSI